MSQHLKFPYNRYYSPEAKFSFGTGFFLLFVLVVTSFVSSCTTAQLKQTGAAVIADAPTIINALGQSGVLGPKTTADAQAAGWALQVLVKKQKGDTITAADITTGIDQVDNVVGKYVKKGTLTATSVDTLSTVANTLINANK